MDADAGEAPTEGRDGLIYARLLGAGPVRDVADWESVRAWRPERGVLWLHLDRSHPQVESWLRAESGLDPLVADALLAEETRPRCTSLPGGLLIILRGVNLNPGADPEDMVSLRVWVSERRVVTVRRRRLIAARDLVARVDAGEGPATAGGLLVGLAERLTERTAPVVLELDEALDALEVAAIDGGGEALRAQLAALRREAIALRRHIAPQRDALHALSTLSTALLSEAERLRLREVGDRVTRYVEDLDALRERAAVTNDELTTRVAEVMNRRMYILSIVAAIFLPLGLLTGLLGINVGGLPGIDNEWAFWIVSVLLVVVGVAMLWVLRRWRLL